MSSDELIIRPKGEDGCRTFSIRVKDEIVIQIDSIAKNTGRSRNEIVGKLLEYAIEHCTIQSE